MDKRLIFDGELLNIVIKRLCFQLIETHQDFENTILVGLQPKGTFLLQRICDVLNRDFGINVKKGVLDATFNRDDFRRRDITVIPHSVEMNYSLESQKVVLIDDVLYTGRSVRAALDALLSYGRPSIVELLVLINRKYSRELPIEPKYIGKSVNTLNTEKVLVELKEQGAEQDLVWLLNKN
jgi:pyrimidine operon attenuation protein/uracil phosphoribosyltransferase